MKERDDRVRGNKLGELWTDRGGFRQVRVGKNHRKRS